MNLKISCLNLIGDASMIIAKSFTWKSDNGLTISETKIILEKNALKRML